MSHLVDLAFSDYKYELGKVTEMIEIITTEEAKEMIKAHFKTEYGKKLKIDLLSRSLGDLVFIPNDR